MVVVTPDASWETTDRCLTVEKRIEDPEGGPEIIAFTIRSSIDVPIAFRIVDSLPDGLSTTDVGFPEEYKFDHWIGYETGQVAYSDTISPEETLAAFYYLEETVRPELHASPTIEVTSPVEPDAAATAGPPSWRNTPVPAETEPTVVDGPLPEALRDGNADGEPDSVVAAETASRGGDETDDADGGSTRDDERIDANVDDASATFAELREEYDREEYPEFSDEVQQHYTDEIDWEELIENGYETESAGAESGSKSGEETSSPRASPADDSVDGEESAVERGDDVDSSAGDRSVLDELVRELDERELSEDDRELFRDVLDLTSPDHTAVQVRHLQSKVADLTAYIDALEAFIDEEGTADEVLDGLEEAVERVRDRIDELETAVNDADEHRADVIRRLETVEEDVEAVPRLCTRVERLDERSDTLATRLDAVDGEIGDVERRLNDRIEPLEVVVDRHESEMEERRDSVDALEDRVERVVSTLQSAASELSSTSER